MLTTNTRPETRSRRLAAPALWAAGALVAVAVLHVRDPHEAGSYAFCPWLALTGTFCPACGGLRAVHDLTHLDVAGAVSSNLLVVVLLPLAGLLWLGWARGRWRGLSCRLEVRALPPAGASWSLLAVVLGFGLVRNLDFAAWLAP